MKSRALIGSLSSDYQLIITSTNKMAASCWHAFDEIKFCCVLQCCFLFVFGIITRVFVLKQLFDSGSVIIGEYSPRLRLGEYSLIITSPLANNCKYCISSITHPWHLFKT